MGFVAGARLGPYEIQSLIGSGGMGEVYRARDSRLERTVAIKVLRADVSGDVARRARFEREAKTIASLSHPRICTLHDVGDHQGQVFLVLEHLTGETLATRLARGALALDWIVEIAAQIGEGLGAAHHAGVVHRDLKPSNVMVTRSGVKLLDFGLAKLQVHGEPAALSAATTTPEGTPITGAGVVLGTLPYMAPEQVQGEEADARTDIWALGAILYEMVTGTRPFEATSAVGLAAAILERDPPDVAALRANVPPALVRLITRCLRKNPDERWESANDVASELRWIGSASDARPSRRNVRWPVLVSLALAAYAVGAATVWLAGGWRRADQRLPAPVVRSIVELQDDVVISASRDALGLGRPALALSPDGTTLAVIAEHAGTAALYVRMLDRAEAIPIGGTEGAYNPFFAPDGRSIGFFAGGRLKKVAARGGTPAVVCEVRNPVGAVWMADDSILIGDQEGTVLRRVQGDNGAPVEGAHARVREGASWPQVLPDGRHALVRDRNGDTLLVSLATGERRMILRNATGTTYLPSGHVLFARDGSLMAAPFDLEALQVTGPAVRLVPDVRMEPSSLAPQFAVSANGTLAYVRGKAALARLTWVDRTGKTEPVVPVTRAFSTFALSPDGLRLAVEVDEPTPDIWILDLSRGAFTRLTTDGVSRNPMWTSDGARVTYHSARPGAAGLYWQPWDGGAPPERLLDLPARTSGSWSADGRELVYNQVGADGDFDLWLLRFDGRSRTTSPWLQSPYTEWGGVWSPGGRWLAYTSDESGRYEVYVRSASGKGRKWQVSGDGGEEPRWSADKRELFFRNGQRWLVAAVVSDGPEFASAPAHVLFDGPFINTPGPSYDVSPDGRFIVLSPSGDDEGTRQVQLVLNWLEEVTAKVPTGSRRAE